MKWKNVRPTCFHLITYFNSIKRNYRMKKCFFFLVCYFKSMPHFSVKINDRLVWKKKKIWTQFHLKTLQLVWNELIDKLVLIVNDFAWIFIISMWNIYLKYIFKKKSFFLFYQYSFCVVCAISFIEKKNINLKYKMCAIFFFFHL